MTGVTLSLGAGVLVIWLVAAATEPMAYAVVQGSIASWIGQVVLFSCTFAFFLHFCGGIRHPASGIRHLVWEEAMVNVAKADCHCSVEVPVPVQCEAGRFRAQIFTSPAQWRLNDA